MSRGAGNWQPVVMPGAETFEIASARTGETYRILVRVPAEPALISQGAPAPAAQFGQSG